MKNEGMKKHMSRWTALLAAVLCMALCASLATGCAAGSAEARTDPRPVSETEEKMDPESVGETVEQTETDESADPVEPKADGEFTVMVTELGNDSFLLEDAGSTPGLNVTISLPESWAGRYAYRIYSGGISFYCKATYDETKDTVEFPMGRLFTVEVENGFVPLDMDYDWNARVLAAAGDYSVICSGVSDVQSTESTQEEYNDMLRKVDEVRFDLSDWMLANTWNETNWIDGSVTLYESDGRQFTRIVLCDETTSAVIREMLETRTFEENEQKHKDGTSIDLELLVNGRRYFMMGMNGADGWSSGEIMDRTGKFAVNPLSEEERAQIHWIQEYGGTLRGEEMMQAMEAALAYFKSETADGMLDGHKVTFVKHIVSPDPDATTRCRERGDIGGSDWAFFLTVIFVPENPEDIQYYMAGNTHEYTGDNPGVPEGAFEYHRVGCIAREADGWHVEIAGTGW